MRRDSTTRRRGAGLALLGLVACVGTAAVARQETPRAAAQGYLEACRSGDYAAAARYLDLTALGREDADGATRARHLKVVLDEKLWIDLEALSDAPEGDLADGLAPGLERLGPPIETGRGEVEVLLERKRHDDGDPRWLVSSATVSAIPTLYEQFGRGRLGEVLPDPFFDLAFLGAALWQWAGIVVVLAVACLLAWLVAWLLVRVAGALAARTATDLDDRVAKAVAAPARLLVLVLLFAVGHLPLRLPAPVEDAVVALEKALVVLALAWVLARLADIFSDVAVERLRAQQRTALVSVVPLGRKAAKVVIAVLAVIVVLQNAGFSVTGLLAGLGIGGLAIALAAQKSLENLFGGLALIADRPVRVGDVCRFGDKAGMVEDIGLRSTRIRTPDRSVVSVPNADFSSAQIENLTRRDRLRLQATLGLRYETSPDQLRHVLAELRRTLLAHPRIVNEPCRARFAGFGAYSLDVEVEAYVDTRDLDDFLAVREDVFLRIIDVVEASGAGFAFPSSTTYIGRDRLPDPARRAAAEEAVRGWREAGALPFPDFGDAVKRDLRGTLAWPPEGSALAAGRGGREPGRR